MEKEEDEEELEGSRGVDSVPLPACGGWGRAGCRVGGADSPAPNRCSTSLVRVCFSWNSSSLAASRLCFSCLWGVRRPPCSNRDSSAPLATSENSWTRTRTRTSHNQNHNSQRTQCHNKHIVAIFKVYHYKIV